MKTEHPQASSDSSLNLSERARQVIRVPWRNGLTWPKIFDRPDTEHESPFASLGLSMILLEWSIVLVAVLLFTSNFLNLDPQRVLPGNEAQVFQILDWTLVKSLSEHGQFPLWNPYLRTGMPFVSDPFLHVYNPLVTIPVLLFGVLSGYKIGLFLSFLAAGLGMWWLAAVLGMSRPTRLWVAGMYAFSGVGVARFIQGEYDFVMGFAWIPWILANLILVTRTRRRLHAAWAILSMALLFFSGNVYYAYYALFVVVLYCLLAIFDARSAKRVFSFSRRKAGIFAVIGILALLLIAVQLLPLVEFWPRISKAGNATLKDSQTIQEIFLDFVSREPRRAEGIVSIAPEEFYAYIGIWPFLALLLLPLAIWKRNKRPLLFFGLVVVFVFAWIDVQHMPWRDFYVRSKLLTQFRYPSRILVFGACAILALAGLALDTLWKMSIREDDHRDRESLSGRVRWVGPRLVLLLLAGFMVWSVVDVYTTNKPYTQTRERYDVPYEIMNWLRNYDQSEYYVSAPNGWHGAVFSNGLRFFNAWYGFEFVKSPAGWINERRVPAQPKYVVLGNHETLDQPGVEVVRRFDTHTIYKVSDTLPIAFSVQDAKLAKRPDNPVLRRDEVTQQTLYASGPNAVEIIAAGEAGAKLVVLATHYPGWRVTVDGREQELQNVEGYLATDFKPGVHKYVFSFSPFSFKFGLLLSVLALSVTLGLVVSDLRFFRWQGVAADLRRLRTWSMPALDRLRQPFLPAPQAAAEEATATDAVVEVPAHVEPRWRRLLAYVEGWLSDVSTLEWSLFGLALLAYAVTRLRALDAFPIYFFADEATLPLLAEELINRGFRGASGEWFPIYFEAAGSRWTPLFPVYVHALTMGLFGKSILVTRATSAVVTIIGAAAVGLILRLIFKIRYWWVGVLVMLTVPAWFLHSRTAFETAMMVSFFACFLLFYLLYRYRDPRYLFAALPFGAFTFYAYSNGQAVMGFTALFLLVSDLRYHIRQWRTLGWVLIPALVFAYPFVAFRLNEPSAMQEHLHVINSYWFEAVSLKAKLLRFLETYWYGLSPQYWFFPNDHDLARHNMAGYGHIRTELLLLFLVGVGLALWRIRSAAHRAVIVAALAAPVGASLVAIGITRVLAFVVPASILITLGIDWLLTRLPDRIPYDVVATVVFIVLLLFGFSMVQDALAEGPLWYNDYGLYGMQYGAKQLFKDTVPEILQQDPDVRLVVSSDWANAADRFIRFFLPEHQQSRVQTQTIHAYLFEKLPLRNTILVLTPNEYQKALSSSKFKTVEIEHVVHYPDGNPGFYFTRLEYVDNVEAVFAAEHEARRRPVEEEVVLDGQTVRFRHSRFDMGKPRDMFDGNRLSLVRGLQANPLMLELTFPEPRTLSGLAADFATMDFTWVIEVYEAGTDEPIVYSETYADLPPDPHVEIDFDRGPHDVTKLHIEIKNDELGDTAKIHVRELTLR